MHSPESIPVRMLFLDGTLAGCASPINFRLAADLRSLHHPRLGAVFPSRQSTTSHVFRTGMGLHAGSMWRRSIYLERHLVSLGNNLETNLVDRESTARGICGLLQHVT